MEIGDRVEHRDGFRRDGRPIPGLRGTIVAVHQYVVEWDEVIREGMIEGKVRVGFYPPSFLLPAQEEATPPLYAGEGGTSDAGLRVPKLPEEVRDFLAPGLAEGAAVWVAERSPVLPAKSKEKE